MRRATILPIVGIAVGFLASASVRADPVLLASVERHVSGAGAPEPEFRVRIVLTHTSLPPPLNEVRLGDDIWWEDGQSGIVDFDIQTDPEFAEFASRLTDGVDEVLFILVVGTRGGGGPGGFESTWLEGSPDLIGNELDFIRLIVYNVRLEPWDDPLGGGPGVRHDVDVRYEFWGQPIPEPTSLSLLALGALTLVRKRARVACSRLGRCPALSADGGGIWQCPQRRPPQP